MNYIHSQVCPPALWWLPPAPLTCFLSLPYWDSCRCADLRPDPLRGVWSSWSLGTDCDSGQLGLPAVSGSWVSIVTQGSWACLPVLSACSDTAVSALAIAMQLLHVLHKGARGKMGSCVQRLTSACLVVLLVGAWVHCGQADGKPHNWGRRGPVGDRVCHSLSHNACMCCASCTSTRVCPGSPAQQKKQARKRAHRWRLVLHRRAWSWLMWQGCLACAPGHLAGIRCAGILDCWVVASWPLLFGVSEGYTRALVHIIAHWCLVAQALPASSNDGGNDYPWCVSYDVPSKNWHISHCCRLLLMRPSFGAVC